MRDIEGTRLLREMVESDDNVKDEVVQTENTRITFGELRRLVRSVLKEEVQMASEEMNAPDDLVQEDPLYPGDDGLGQGAETSACGGCGACNSCVGADAASSEEEEFMMQDLEAQALEDEEMAMMLATAEMHGDAEREGDFPPRGF